MGFRAGYHGARSQSEHSAILCNCIICQAVNTVTTRSPVGLVSSAPSVVAIFTPLKFHYAAKASFSCGVVLLAAMLQDKKFIFTAS